MDLISSQEYCPYCDTRIELLLDPSAGSIEMIEDCSVCCRPIRICPDFDEDGQLTAIRLLREDD